MILPIPLFCLPLVPKLRLKNRYFRALSTLQSTQLVKHDLATDSQIITDKNDFIRGESVKISASVAITFPFISPETETWN